MYIAELSCNHVGELAVCLQMLDAAKLAGADTVKIQLFTPEQMTLKRYGSKFVIPDGLWKGRNLWDLYEECRTPKEWLSEIQGKCNSLGLNLMVSVFHPDMVEYCEDHGVLLYKVASPEVGYLELLEELAFTTKPVFVSTGLASRKELEELPISNLTLMHCVTEYPCRMGSCNLLTLLDLVKLGNPIGLSDHTDSIVAPVVATTLGAVAIEKHFKIVEDCPDSAFSLNPRQFHAMVQACEDAKASLGVIRYSGGGRYKRQTVDGSFVRVVE